MGEMGEIYKDLKETYKTRKAAKQRINFIALREWLEKDEELQNFVEYREHSVLFRFPGKPKADFFPTTNKWRSKNKTFYGGAKSFLNWYEKQ